MRRLLRGSRARVAGGILALALLTVTVVLAWGALVHAAATVAVAVIGYRMLRHRFFPRPPRRAGAGRGLLEAALAAGAGWWAGRRVDDAVGHAVRTGAEVQLHVKPAYPPRRIR